MKCTRCSKIIPDGFTDCPWCGATYAAIPAAPALGIPAPPPMPVCQQAPSSLNVILAWISSVLSLPLVTFAAYVATMRKYGDVTPENSGFAIGGFVGPYLVSSIAVLAFFWFRKSRPHYSTKLLGIACGASLLAILSLVGGLQSAPAGAAPRPSRTAANPVHGSTPPGPRSVPASKWDPAIRSFFADLHSFDEQYLSEVGQFDNSSLPIYTPESFRDAPTIQQILAQLHGRLAVADKFASIDSLLSKMPEHVQSVGAGEEDKRTFLENFQASTHKDLGARKVVKDIERDWLNASVGLYEFTLSRQGAYALRDGNLVFKSNAAASEFNRKLQNAGRLRAQFFQAYRASQNQLAMVLAQYGLQPSDFDSATAQ